MGGKGQEKVKRTPIIQEDEIITEKRSLKNTQYIYKNWFLFLKFSVSGHVFYIKAEMGQKI